jgi:polysaccharide biosynthesis/export protein
MNSRLLSATALLLAGGLVAGHVGSVLAASGVTDAYVLGPGDTIDIVVVGERDLSQTMPIKPDGTVDLPLVGEVMAAGKTTSQLATELVKRYAKYLIAPSITVAVREVRVDHISVLGQVNRPGEYPIQPGEGILDVLASAGGPTDRADLAKAQVLRGNPTQTIDLNILGAFAKGQDPDVTLLPGDVVYVPATDRRMVILGQVNRPGAYDLLEGEHVSDLLAAAGGPTPLAAPQRAFIVRGDQQIPVNVQDVLAGNLEANLPLQPGDMLVVPQGQAQIVVMGAVNRPGKYDFLQGMKLIDAVAQAGGQATIGNLSQVAVVRLEDGKTKTTVVHLDRALSGKDMSQNIAVQPGDVVYVPERGVTLEKTYELFSVLGVVRYLFGIF